MVAVPSLDELTPRAWLEAMDRVRDATAEEAARVLDTTTNPAEAIGPLQAIFDRYNDVDLRAQFSEEVLEDDLSVEVRMHDDTLVFWVFPTEDYESIVYTDAGYWWLDHDGVAGAADRHAIHRDLVLRLLRILPWANDDDLQEMVAIEIASRAG